MGLGRPKGNTDPPAPTRTQHSASSSCQCDPDEAKRADAFLAALRRKLQPCTKGAIEIDQLDKWFRTNSKVLWPKGSSSPADFDMEAWLRAHGHRAGVAVQTRDAASGRAGLVQVAIEDHVKGPPSKKKKTAAPKPSAKKKGAVMKKKRAREAETEGGSKRKKGGSDDFIPM